MQKLVIFSGSGVSAESGIKTFRDSGGLWEDHDIYEVATPEAWQNNPTLVTEFYNARRKQVIEAIPNKAHLAIAELDNHFDVTVITQNVDDLHERAGSKKVIHLHGEIMKARSSVDPNLIYHLDKPNLTEEDICDKGSRLRPNIVWFGEPVPLMELAATEVILASTFIVIGTSLEVYPAASLVDLVPTQAVKYYIDPNANKPVSNFHIIQEKAGVAMPNLSEKLIQNK